MTDEAYSIALEAWRTGKTSPRPARRPDNVPTRIDSNWHTPAEQAIGIAMLEVEKAGGSTALTDAVNLLSQARDRVADHVEGKTE